MNSDNNATVPQVVLVTSCGTVYYLNPSLRPNLVEGVQPSNVSLTAPTTVRRPEVVPAESTATPRTEPTAFTVQDLPLMLASLSRNHLPERNWPNITEIFYNGTSCSASLRVPLTQPEQKTILN